MPTRGGWLSYKQKAIYSTRGRYGFFVLIRNQVKDPVAALSLYRLRCHREGILKYQRAFELLDEPNVIECSQNPEKVLILAKY